MKSRRLWLVGFIGIALMVRMPAYGNTQARIRVLILSGSNNHNWQKTTPCLKQIFDANDLFQVSVTEQPQTCGAEDLANIDVIVSNWNAFGKGKADTDWPAPTRTAFLDFIRQGGGHVMVHAGGSSFYDWPEYHRIAASWGPKTSHGPMHTFKVEVADPNHALVRGVKPFSIRDELWNSTKFPEDSHVLLTAHSSQKNGGTGQPETLLCVSSFGRGRCVNLMLGHDVSAMRYLEFQQLLSRSCAWAGHSRLEQF
ncbi:MAG: ThuA domain-containing protein [Phycisphaeraceae bacterium]|nr:ThuA domain-containing protein [Phycisphaeraceae bacterium]